MGSMLPQIDWAIKNDMAILIVNPTCNQSDLLKRRSFLNYSSLQFKYIWKKYVVQSGLKRINIIAFAEGGKDVFDLIEQQ